MDDPVGQQVSRCFFRKSPAVNRHKAADLLRMLQSVADGDRAAHGQTDQCKAVQLQLVYDGFQTVVEVRIKTFLRDLLQRLTVAVTRQVNGIDNGAFAKALHHFFPGKKCIVGAGAVQQQNGVGAASAAIALNVFPAVRKGNFFDIHGDAS